VEQIQRHVAGDQQTAPDRRPRVFQRHLEPVHGLRRGRAFGAAPGPVEPVVKLTSPRQKIDVIERQGITLGTIGQVRDQRPGQVRDTPNLAKPDPSLPPPRVRPVGAKDATRRVDQDESQDRIVLWRLSLAPGGIPPVAGHRDRRVDLDAVVLNNGQVVVGLPQLPQGALHGGHLRGLDQRRLVRHDRDRAGRCLLDPVARRQLVGRIPFLALLGEDEAVLAPRGLDAVERVGVALAVGVGEWHRRLLSWLLTHASGLPRPVLAAGKRVEVDRHAGQ
jgi:hypothetical protein